jgi:Fe-Mn family superoxide dismutase
MKHLKDYSELSPIFEGKKVQFERKPLNYSLSSLSPSIDKATMDEHYNVHYAAYTKKLNEAVKEENIDVFMGPDMQGIKQILKNIRKYSAKVRNNGGGFYNHFLYFENLSPEKKNPKGALRESIIRNFGSLAKFKKQFLDAGLNQFGSGWVWLVQNGNVIEIMTTTNQDNPLMDRAFVGEILLGMDVWEHAYYLKHKADRKSYIQDFFEVIDWDVVEQRMKK